MLTFTASVHKYFYKTGIRANPYLFYNYVTPSGKIGKLMSSISFEVNYMITIVVLLIICKSLSPLRSVKNIINPFIWISIIDLIDYFVFYKQLSIIKLPLLIVLVIIYNRRIFFKK